MTIETRVPAASTPERLLNSLPQSRERLGGISRSTLYELVGKGELRIVKIGRRSFIPEESLRAFAEKMGA